jgi:excisionase family DNA binding protein
VSGEDARVELMLPGELLEAIAERAAELVLARQQAARETRWMTIAEAAEYAGCGRQRIYDLRSDGRLKRHGDGRRALVDRYELDAYLGNSR